MSLHTVLLGLELKKAFAHYFCYLDPHCIFPNVGKKLMLYSNRLNAKHQKSEQ